MKVTRRLLPLLFLLLPALAGAEITLLTSQPATSEQHCDASVQLRLTGSAGPFHVLVPNGAGRGEDLLLQYVSGDVTIDGLCSTIYALEIYPSAYASCRTTLTANLKANENSALPTTTTATEPLADVDFRLYPNPTRDRAEFTVSGSPALEGERGKDWVARLTDAEGRLVRTATPRHRIRGGAARLSGRLNLADLPPATYLLQITDGTQSWVRPIVKQ